MAWQNRVLTFSMAVELQGHQTVSQSEATTSAGSHPGWRQTAGWLLTAAKVSKSLVVSKQEGIECPGYAWGSIQKIQSSVGMLKSPVKQLWPTKNFFKQSCPLAVLELAL